MLKLDSPPGWVLLDKHYAEICKDSKSRVWIFTYNKESAQYDLLSSNEHFCAEAKNEILQALRGDALVAIRIMDPVHLDRFIAHYDEIKNGIISPSKQQEAFFANIAWQTDFFHDHSFLLVLNHDVEPIYILQEYESASK